MTRGQAWDTLDGQVEVRRWAYVLQPEPAGLTPESLSADPADLLVIDPSRTGRPEDAWTPSQVAAFQRRADGGRRIVAAYLSIGEVEDYRPWWDPSWTHTGKARGKTTPSAPAWLGPVNPDWPESRKVRYWDPGWQAMLFNDTCTGPLDALVAQGFDAAYLDIIDAYEFWSMQIMPVDQRLAPADAASRMIDLVVAICGQARRVNPRFCVIPQNGAGILRDLGDDPARRDAYLDAIGAIGQEDLFFYGDADEDNPENPQQEVVDDLRRDFLGRQKPVLVVDYLTDPVKIERFKQLCGQKGFVPLACPRRALDRHP